jgi:hypothetical protein
MLALLVDPRLKCPGGYARGQADDHRVGIE